MRNLPGENSISLNFFLVKEDQVISMDSFRYMLVYEPTFIYSFILGSR